jgi:hypothetical protein
MKRSTNQNHGGDLQRVEREIEASLLYASFLIADVRHCLSRKTGFDPDQPRDDHGRWTLTGGSDATGYSPDKPGWHYYTVGPNLVCTANQNCSAEEIADHLARFAVPGQNPAIPAENNKTYPVYDPITGVYVGDVNTKISDDGLTIQNKTKENHIFHDGQITRYATQKLDGSWSVTTRGTGNNRTPGMNILNRYGGPVIFDIMDERMRENIRMHHGTRKSLEAMDCWQPGRLGGRRGNVLGDKSGKTGGAHAH